MSFVPPRDLTEAVKSLLFWAVICVAWSYWFFSLRSFFSYRWTEEIIFLLCLNFWKSWKMYLKCPKKLQELINFKSQNFSRIFFVKIMPVSSPFSMKNCFKTIPTLPFMFFLTFSHHKYIFFPIISLPACFYFQTTHRQTYFISHRFSFKTGDTLLSLILSNS